MTVSCSSTYQDAIFFFRIEICCFWCDLVMAVFDLEIYGALNAYQCCESLYFFFIPCKNKVLFLFWFCVFFFFAEFVN